MTKLKLIIGLLLLLTLAVGAYSQDIHALIDTTEVTIAWDAVTTDSNTFVKYEVCMASYPDGETQWIEEVETLLITLAFADNQGLYKIGVRSNLYLNDTMISQSDINWSHESIEPGDVPDPFTIAYYLVGAPTSLRMN